VIFFFMDKLKLFVVINSMLSIVQLYLISEYSFNEPLYFFPHKPGIQDLAMVFFFFTCSSSYPEM